MTLSLPEKAQRKLERASFHTNLQAGDILSCRWGIEDTYFDFYRVINVTSRNKVEVEVLEKERLPHIVECVVQPMSATVEPLLTPVNRTVISCLVYAGNEVRLPNKKRSAFKLKKMADGRWPQMIETWMR